ncbi:hypothetical protein EBI01_18975 [Marinomonas rhizomae]|uniref:O-antigen/teichoic acid export membrane protein n=1 Tax=Marinomonas rhizomae TaxID=491948 RepID=A0A366JAK2_9GAMM|nr:oligosaccharide flippase family protein [Marinomonas rhizomae]RBP83275.1 O-antigen/teichoic acid export membrane protein [Marinomonas rhizomae]RNF69387.1 hypothetical protein EBI01_18975 [Marinomonas rhizomae]
MNFFLLLSKNFIAQFLLLLSLPLISRYFIPESVGALGVFTATVSIISTISTLRLELVLARKPENIKSNYVFSLFLIFISLLLSLVMSILYQMISKYIGFNSIEFKWLFLSSWLFSVSNVFLYYYNGKGQFDISGNSKVIRVLAYLLFICFFIFFDLYKYEYSLIYAFSFSYLIVVFYYINFFGLSLFLLSGLRRVSFLYIKKYKNYIKFTFPHHLINVTTSNFPIILLGYYFSLEEVGYYTLAQKLMLTPLGVISATCSSYLANKVFSKKIKREKKIIIFNNFSTLLFLVGAIVVVFWVIFGRPLVIIILGESWEGVYHMAIYMIPWIILLPLASSMSVFPTLLNQNKKALIVEIVSFLLRVSSLAIGVYNDSFNLSIMLFSIASLVVMLYQYFWVRGMVIKGIEHDRV